MIPYFTLVRKLMQENLSCVLLQDQESDFVNYAALQFSNKKSKRTRRHCEMEDPHVVYSSVR